MEHERLDIEVVEWPEVHGGCSSSGGRRGERLLAEAEYVKLVDGEVQTPEAEGLEWREDGGSPQPTKRGRRELQRAKTNHIARARYAENGGKVRHPVTKSTNARRIPMDDAKLSVRNLADREIYVVCRALDRMWPSIQ